MTAPVTAADAGRRANVEARRIAGNAPLDAHIAAKVAKSAGARVTQVARDELGLVVHSFEQRRRSTIARCPDLIIWLPGLSTWWEAKAPSDRFTDAQFAFCEGEYRRGRFVAAGDAGEARTLLMLLVLRAEPIEQLRELCWASVLTVSARGRRKEPS